MRQIERAKNMFAALRKFFTKASTAKIKKGNYAALGNFSYRQRVTKGGRQAVEQKLDGKNLLQFVDKQMFL